MVYGARQWAQRSFGDGGGALANAVPASPLITLYAPGAYGGSAIGVNAYCGSAAVTPGVIPPVVYTVSMTGNLPIAGALGPKSLVALSAGVSSSGAFVLQVNKRIAGTLTTAGTLTLRATDIRITGLLTPTGVLRRITARSLSSTITPAGALHKTVTLVPFTGPLDLSGTVEVHKQSSSPSLSGTLTSAGAIRLVASKFLVSSMSMGAAVSYGIQSPGGYAGTIAPMGSLTLTYPNGMTGLARINLSGALTLVALHRSAGSVASAGSVQKIGTRRVTGALTITAVSLINGRRYVLGAGSIAPAGGWRPTPQKKVSAAITSGGILSREVLLNLSGSVSSAGSRTLQGPGVGTASFLAVESNLRMSGQLSNVVTKNLAGMVTPWSTLLPVYYEPLILVPGFVYSKYRRGVLLP